jgi:hypothetical protein
MEGLAAIPLSFSASSFSHEILAKSSQQQKAIPEHRFRTKHVDKKMYTPPPPREETPEKEEMVAPVEEPKVATLAKCSLGMDVIISIYHEGMCVNTQEGFGFNF